MALLLKNAHVVDPSVELDGVVDVLIDSDKIAEVGENLAVEGAEVRDLSGKYLVPGGAETLLEGDVISVFAMA